MTPLQIQARYFRAIKSLMGSPHDGSLTTVKLWQDEATLDYHLKAGNVEYYNSSFGSLMDKIIESEK